MRLPQHSFLKSFDQRLNTPHIMSPSRFAAGGADFTDDYSSTTGWTAVGSNVTVTGGAATAATATMGNNRLHKALGFTLSDTLWYADFQINISANSTDNHHIPFSLSAGTGRPDVSTSTDSISLQEYAPTPTPRLAAQDGTGSVVVDYGTGFTLSTTYYPRMERTSATANALAIFTDSGRTTDLGTPVTDIIPSTIISLNTLQHHTNGNAARTGSWTVDNTSVWNGVSP